MLVFPDIRDGQAGNTKFGRQGRDHRCNTGCSHRPPGPVTCHTLERVVKPKYCSLEFLAVVLPRMQSCVNQNLKNDQYEGYLLPHWTNVRRVFVQHNTPGPVLWVGNNHVASIVKLEPLR